MNPSTPPRGRMVAANPGIVSDEVAERVRSVRFTPVVLREGYAMGPVDELLEQVETSARYGLPVDKLLDQPRLPRSRFREGYAIEEVDAFVDDVRRTLAGEAGAADGAPRGAGGSGDRVDRGATPATGPKVAQWIRSTSFSQVRLREGYDMAEVDALMGRLASVAEAGADLTAELHGLELTRVRLRDGYDLDEVDRFLAALPAGAAMAAHSPGLDPRAEELVSRIENTRFTPVRLREGYAMEEVDAFLDRVVALVRADRPLGDLLAGASFTPVRLREGYDMGEVDDFLAELARP